MIKVPQMLKYDLKKLLEREDIEEILDKDLSNCDNISELITMVGDLCAHPRGADAGLLLCYIIKTLIDMGVKLNLKYLEENNYIIYKSQIENTLPHYGFVTNNTVDCTAWLDCNTRYDVDLEESRYGYGKVSGILCDWYDLDSGNYEEEDTRIPLNHWHEIITTTDDVIFVDDKVIM